jgi:hypothetical protein
MASGHAWWWLRAIRLDLDRLDVRDAYPFHEESFLYRAFPASPDAFPRHLLD